MRAWLVVQLRSAPTLSCGAQPERRPLAASRMAFKSVALAPKPFQWQPLAASASSSRCQSLDLTNSLQHSSKHSTLADPCLWPAANLLPLAAISCPQSVDNESQFDANCSAAATLSNWQHTLEAPLEQQQQSPSVSTGSLVCVLPNCSSILASRSPSANRRQRHLIVICFSFCTTSIRLSLRVLLGSFPSPLATLASALPKMELIIVCFLCSSHGFSKSKESKLNKSKLKASNRSNLILSKLIICLEFARNLPKFASANCRLNALESNSN